jgi:SPP1 gp7 family putative phage head morphogenesis protein
MVAEIINMRKKLLHKHIVQEGAIDGVINAVRDAVLHGKTMDTLVENIGKIIKDNRPRALRIARTESAGFSNALMYSSMYSAGVKRHRWITAMDERVRATHDMAMIQGPINIGDRFVNGLQYPGDPNGPPEEVINCRCTIVPAM